MHRLAAALVIGMSALAFAQTPPPALPPSPATRPATQPLVAADRSTPRGALRVFYAATDTGDEAALRASLFTATTTEDQVADTMAKMAAAGAGLQAAMKAAFGPAPFKAADARLAARAAERDASITAGTETITGDTATVVLDASQMEPIEFRKVEGQWKLRLGKTLEKQDPAQVARLLAALPIQIKAIQETTADVTNGKVKSLAEVQQTLEARSRQGVTEFDAAERAKAATQPTTQP